MNAGTSSQKLMLFSRGNAMSGAPIISGMNQLPNPPISTGMTEKKIISSPCEVIAAFQDWPDAKICIPGLCNSMRIRIETISPAMPPTSPKMMYSVPISLWLVLNSHRWAKLSSTW